MTDTDQLTTDLLDAGLTWSQLYAIEQKLGAARSLASVIKEQSDYKSDLWDDMDGLFAELHEAVTPVLAAMKAELAGRMAAHAGEVMNPTTHLLEVLPAVTL